MKIKVKTWWPIITTGRAEFEIELPDGFLPHELVWENRYSIIEQSENYHPHLDLITAVELGLAGVETDDFDKETKADLFTDNACCKRALLAGDWVTMVDRKYYCDKCNPIPTGPRGEVIE